eukprot:COSAG01_NODE_2514_length_7530_cov_192.547302_1_plen_229_part_00
MWRGPILIGLRAPKLRGCDAAPPPPPPLLPRPRICAATTAATAAAAGGSSCRPPPPPSMSRGRGRPLDCALNGRCVSNKCVCSAGWTGAGCARLRLLPATKGQGFYGIASNWSSRGNKVRQDPSTGKFYMAADEMSFNCGLGTWQTNSRSVMAEADNVTGPYLRKQVVVDSWSHGTWMERDPLSGRWILGHMGGGRQQTWQRLQGVLVGRDRAGRQVEPLPTDVQRAG